MQDGDVIDAKLKTIGGWVEDKEEELEEGRKAEESSEEDEEGASRAKKRRKRRGGCPLLRSLRAAEGRAPASARRSGSGAGAQADSKPIAQLRSELSELRQQLSALTADARAIHSADINFGQLDYNKWLQEQRAVARSGTARERAQETLRQARATSKRREGERARKRARKTTGLF